MIKWWVLGALGVLWIPIQGYLVFLWFGHGQFLSQSGIECTVIPVFVELVVAVTSAMHFDRIHSGAVANPHSPIGQKLLNGSRSAPCPAANPRGLGWRVGRSRKSRRTDEEGSLGRVGHEWRRLSRLWHEHDDA